MSASAALLDQKRLFFIIGLGRGGTSLLQELMGAFEGFENIGESRLDGRSPEAAAGMSCFADIQRLGDFTKLEAFIRETWKARFYAEKTPNSILCLPQLAERYPEACYLFLERNPLHAVLSVMNMFPEGPEDQAKRSYDLKAGNASPLETGLGYESYYARQCFKRVSAQVLNKSLFKNRLTLRYETLVGEPRAELGRLAEHIGIAVDWRKAEEVLARPSYSSRSNSYAKRSISDPEAAELVGRACGLWSYPALEAPVGARWDQ